ncbi:hypothetical protein OsJ_27458 [Oryza sativa Japonica Group]|uniref:Exostosin GT47 domain-containing protein n=1 Tax=Oryza sativa subsp. japonica TaxID=39947 RepID=B9G143_ORYSJ|nr:hypothetical protein OsJ_27458 [Oryza sativa Japonica Group]
MALTRRLLIDLSSRRRLFNAGKFSTTHKKKPVLHEAVSLAGFLRCSRALVSWMVAERKMQPSPAAPPAAEHRRRALLRYVVFLAVSLLAFSCWALVSSRIDGAVLAATAGGEHDDHDGIIVRSSTQAEMPARGGNATSRGAVEVGVGTPAAMITRQPSSGETTTTAALAATCDAESALLRVYLYDLPPEFHFGMLGWDGKAAGAAWPDVAGDPRAVPRYPGGLNLQHSVEYWLTLDILSSTTSGDHRAPPSVHRREGDEREPCRRVPGAVLRVAELQPAVEVAARRPWEWRPERQAAAGRAGEVPGEAGGVAAVGRRGPPRRAAPPEQHDGRPAAAQRRHVRPLRLRQGGRVRQRLYQLIKDEKDVHFTYGSVRQNGIRRATKGMASSKFCLNIAGDTPSSNRLFDAIVSHCVPVIISDDIELPFEDVLDYSAFCVFVRASDAVKRGFLLHLLRGISQEEWTAMWRRLKEVAHHFEYQYPSQPGDAVQMIWGAVARKMHLVKLQLHKRGRYQRTFSES